MSGRAQGRKAFITGAAGGLGFGIAKLFLAEGAAVAIADLRGADGARDSLGGNSLAVTVGGVLSMLTVVCHFKKVAHRVWDYFIARLALTMAAFNLLGQWHGLKPDEDGFIQLSIAEFSL